MKMRFLLCAMVVMHVHVRVESFRLQPATIKSVFGNGFEVDREYPDLGEGSYAVVNDRVYFISHAYCKDEMMMMMGQKEPCNKFDVYYANADGSQDRVHEDEARADVQTKFLGKAVTF